MRILCLLIISMFFGTGLGFLLGGGLQVEEHDHAGHGSMDHDHSALTDWPSALPAPDITLQLIDDGEMSRNLRIITKGYRWAPEEVNGEVTQGAGHAHVYINGQKVARVYGEWVHLPEFPNPEQSPVRVRVTLNANDHSGWGFDGQPIAAELLVTAAP